MDIFFFYLVKLEVSYVLLVLEKKILKVVVRRFVNFGFGLNYLYFLFKRDRNVGVKSIF